MSIRHPLIVCVSKSIKFGILNKNCPEIEYARNLIRNRYYLVAKNNRNESAMKGWSVELL